jgi:hypothetical protein
LQQHQTEDVGEFAEESLLLEIRNFILSS